jgi:hypothetical protein
MKDREGEPETATPRRERGTQTLRYLVAYNTLERARTPGEMVVPTVTSGDSGSGPETFEGDDANARRPTWAAVGIFGVSVNSAS